MLTFLVLLHLRELKVGKSSFFNHRNKDVYLPAIVKLSGTLQKQSNNNPTRAVKCIFMPCLDTCVLVCVVGVSSEVRRALNYVLGNACLSGRKSASVKNVDDNAER